MLSVEANKMTAIEKENYLSLQADAVALRNELIELYKNHIKAIDELPTSVDLENTKKELDEKYPTEPTDEIEYTPAEEVQPEPQPQVMHEPQPTQVVPQQEVREVAEVDDTKVAVKRQSKFNHLKFGDNYDVSAE